VQVTDYWIGSIEEDCRRMNLHGSVAIAERLA